MADEFLYGAATSSHQVEGNNVNNDWWEWEQKKPPHHRSGAAAAHYTNFSQDFALAKSLGHNAHRISLEWSRIEPEQGRFNKDALNHYKQVLSELKKNKLKSFVTLHHFTNPQWFSRRGGWTKKEAVEIFSDYVKTASSYLGDDVDYWITINEPMVYATQAYWRRRWPPQKRSFLTMNKVIKNMAAAHRKAYRILHRDHPTKQIGLAKHFIVYLDVESATYADKWLKTVQNWWFNQRFYKITGNTHDFLGVNYYFAFKHKLKFWPPKVVNQLTGIPVSDLNWPIYPKGLEELLNSLKKYNLPIYITENGLADANDNHRAQFIRQHLRAVEQAQHNGAHVKGYLHWSLIDNFEWDLGFEPRFGLVEVNYKTMKRTPRPSAYVYQAIIKQAQGR